MKKILPLLLIMGAVYFLTRKKQPAGLDPNTAEGQSYKLLSDTLEADPVFLEVPFPANFYEAVNADHAAQQAGNPRTPDYAAGYPGSFMSVADAWQPAMKFSEDTHAKLWQIYAAYKTAISKSV